jgi:uncharacterized protein YbjT (DUF2867 family)
MTRARVFARWRSSPLGGYDAAVLDFFQTSSRNILAAEVAAGVNHHVALSVVGADRLSDSGYLRAKVAQEETLDRRPAASAIDVPRLHLLRPRLSPPLMPRATTAVSRRTFRPVRHDYVG